MSDRMHCIPFRNLLDWVLGEWEESGSRLRLQEALPRRRRRRTAPAPFMGRFLETPIGPAAGPNTQLEQNIAASYVCGGRMFELKTVQIIDGRGPARLEALHPRRGRGLQLRVEHRAHRAAGL